MISLVPLQWMVLGARKLVDEGMEGDDSLPVTALNEFGYDEAAEHVYGMHYPEWKKQHQKKSTTEQMERFEASKPIQAKHDKTRLEKRSAVAATPVSTVASNVCCQEPPPATSPATKVAKDTRTLPPYVPPPFPTATSTMRFAVLTVSDRAFHNEYATGDLSGPAVVESITHILAEASLNPQQPVETAIVPDDVGAIQQQLRIWTDNAVDCILTTGGTGFAPRDMTPEAVWGILTVELAHVMPWVTGECARRHQPLSSLSRGVVGVCSNSTVIATLPGSPKGVTEMMPFLLPLLLHAVEELRAEKQ